MKTLFRLLLLGALVPCAGLRAGAPVKPETGKVLVLDNDRTLEGDVTHVGDHYSVRRSTGTTTVPVANVARVCASKEDALAFLRKRANLTDPDERLRLARWCHLQGLRKQAAEEARAAVALRPEHAEGQRLLQYFEQAARAATEPARPPAPPPATEAALGQPPVELNAEAMSRFATRVQPILMNACARCHVAPSAGTFRLQRTYTAGLANRRVVKENLAAVLAQLNLRQPEYSPLLVKAVSAHGPSGEAPLKGRQAQAFRTLQDWVRLTLENNPQLRERLAALPPPPEKEPEAPPARPKEPARPAKVVPPQAGVPVTSPTPAAPVQPRPVSVTPAPTPAAPPEPADDPADPYSPGPFNRHMHPTRTAPPPG